VVLVVARGNNEAYIANASVTDMVKMAELELSPPEEKGEVFTACADIDDEYSSAGPEVGSAQYISKWTPFSLFPVS
jgi:hypothetical protein